MFHGGMKLRDWLERENVSAKTFADMVGVRRQAVYYWLSGRAPDAVRGKKIVEVTKGDVTPNDFVIEGVDATST